VDDDDLEEEEEPPPDLRLHQPKKAQRATIAITAPSNPAMTSLASAFAGWIITARQRREKMMVINSTDRPTP